MKKLLQFIIVNLMIIASVSAQENVELQDLKTPSSPGFQILDIAPSTIERPTNPKEFALSLMSLSNNGTTIPKNFAMEISPYWYIKPKDENVYKYLSIKKNDKASIDFSGIWRKLSVSLASTYSDDTSEGVQRNSNYIAVGVRANILTIRTASQNKNFEDALNKIVARIGYNRVLLEAEEKTKLKGLLTILLDQKKAISASGLDITEIDIKISDVKQKIVSINANSSEELEKKLNNDKVKISNMKILEELPLIQIDAAFAYSEVIPDNEYNNKRFNRSGFWLNASLNTFSGGENKNGLSDNLSFLGSVRFITDNVLAENSTDVFKRNNAFDYGGKIEYSIKAFSISIEYLKREYSDNSNLNSERTVGVLQYKISDGVYFTGSYGKNFGEVKNLFTLFGINYGFGNSKLSK
jgi:hypothetical protein